tara:strand:+ start:67 stop:798 length:732 start_codon:yes stop_codon:yes gene_type:complete
MNKRTVEKTFFYQHNINDFIADTTHLDSLHKYAYLTLIWLSHRKQGAITYEDVYKVIKQSPDISLSIYNDVVDEFFKRDLNNDTLYNDRVMLDLKHTKQHKESSSKGGTTSGIKKMIETDKYKDEYEQIHKLTPSSRRIGKEAGLEKYCKLLQAYPETFTFKRIMSLYDGFKKEDRPDEAYPQISTLFNDRDAKYWKKEVEQTSEDKLEYVSKATKWLTENNYNWSNLTERNDLIKQHYKGKL